MRCSLAGMDVELHVKEVAEQGYTIVEDAIEPALIDELNDALARLERFFDVQPSPNSFEGHQTLRIYNLLAFDDVWQRVPVHEHVLPDRRAGARPRLHHLVALVDRHPSRRDRATDPRRRPTHPVAEAAPADGVQLDVGAHRLHRGERRDASDSRYAPVRSQPRLRRRLRLDRGRDAEGLGAHLARQPVARRRRERNRTSRGSASP